VVDLASYRNEYQASSWGVRRVRPTSATSVSRLSRKCGSLSVSQPNGPLRPVTGMALPFYTVIMKRICVYTIYTWKYSHIFTVQLCIVFVYIYEWHAFFFIHMSLSFEVAHKLEIQHVFETYSTGTYSVLHTIVICHISPNIRRPPILRSGSQKMNARE
jgi:hypothetical protein